MTGLRRVPAGLASALGLMRVCLRLVERRP